jgi:transcription elongation factor Elf1
MITAERGAVIVDQNGPHVNFRFKCENCGHVQDDINGSVATQNGTTSVPFWCKQCGRSQEAVLKGPPL